MAAQAPTSIVSFRAQAGVECWRVLGSGTSAFSSRILCCTPSSRGGREPKLAGVLAQAVPNPTIGSPEVRKQLLSVEGNVGEDARGPGTWSEKGKEKGLFNPVQAVGSLVNAAKHGLLNKLMDTIFTETDDPPNRAFLGSFAPVAEISGKTPVQVVAGAVPLDFPSGVYIRNGPNPQFGGRSLTSSLGRVNYHMFEGDGMLHATYFGKGGQVAYLNKYLGTETYKMEKQQGRRVALPSFEGDSSAILLCYLINTLRFGKPNKVTSNTHVFEHAGRYYAVAEGDLPYEFNLSDLTTVGVWHGCNGSWKRPFSAHPFRDPQTKELIIFGVHADKPYSEIGIVSADGERMVHRIDMGLDRCSFCHEIAITKRYNVFFDFPLILSKERLQSGGRIMEFQENDASRIGVLPRYGNGESTKWFPVQTGYSWHKFNTFEDGDEVVVLGLRARRPIIPSPMHMDKLEWWARGVQPIAPLDATDPWVDGALSSQVHEWRLNMVTGEASERDLSGYAYSGEYPSINRSYVGVKNRYGYMCLLDVEGSARTGMGKMRGLVKITFPESAGGDIKEEMHELDSMFGVSEPSFVARPNAQAEDDGWVVAYVHNDITEISYLYIIDAQNFSAEPVAKLQLPHRVPYGYHGTYFYDKEPEHAMRGG